MRSPAARLRLAIVVLAWLAQALLPVAHAAFMNAPAPGGMAWCGDPALAKVAMAALPDEVRQAIADDVHQAEHLATCNLLCAAGSTPPPVPGLAPTEALRLEGVAPAPPGPPVPTVVRPQSPTPPSHAPPPRA